MDKGQAAAISLPKPCDMHTANRKYGIGCQQGAARGLVVAGDNEETVEGIENGRFRGWKSMGKMGSDVTKSESWEGWNSF